MRKFRKEFTHIYITGALMCGVAPAVSGVTVSLDAPGSLCGALAEVDDATRELVLSGSASAAELGALRDSLPELAMLDMHALRLTPAEIPPYIFAATKLTDVKLPDDITVIGEGAFAAIPASAVQLPATLDSIAPYAFAHSGLVAVSLPERLRAVGSNAFGDCVSLSVIDGGAGLLTVGESAFHGAAFENVDMSAWQSLRSLGARAFEGCVSLVSVTLPEQDGYILGEGTFMGCTGLTRVQVGVVKDIPALMLADAPDADVSQLLADGVRTVGAYALSGNRSAYITLPATLDSIGAHGMERMMELDTVDAVTLHSVPALGEEVWHGVDQGNVSLEVSGDMADSFASMPQWQEFKISRPTSSIDGIESVTGGITLRFEGTSLIITAPQTIGLVEAVSVDGMLLARVSPAAAEAIMDASRWPGNVCIVAVTLADGSKATYSLSR